MNIARNMEAVFVFVLGTLVAQGVATAAINAKPVNASVATYSVNEAGNSARVVGTLKDVVKLRELWPRGAPGLWYVSQRVVVERGVGGLEQLLQSALRARSARTSPAASGPG